MLNGELETPEAPGDLQELTKEAAELKTSIADLEAELKGKKESMAAVTQSILRTMELMELDSVRAHGYLFFKEIKTSVSTPKTPEDKEALFEFLRGKGIFLETVSINSQTLNALYKSLAEEAAAEGILDYKMPGVAEPVIYTNLKLRRS